MRIAITGHRPNKLGGDYDLVSPLIGKITDKLQQVIDKYKPTHMISGMALGIDTLWARLAIHNSINLICAIPCLYQDAKWPKRSQDVYHKITQTLINGKYPELVFVTKEPYNNTCMQKRNCWMVDNCDLLIAVWDGSEGGTANCVGYAKTIGREIIRINPKEL